MATGLTWVDTQRRYQGKELGGQDRNDRGTNGQAWDVQSREWRPIDSIEEKGKIWLLGGGGSQD